MAKLEVLYNDDCPICRREIKHYAGLSGDAVEFVKITEQSAADWGLTPDNNNAGRPVRLYLRSKP